jgi:hypothetical protein
LNRIELKLFIIISYQIELYDAIYKLSLKVIYAQRSPLNFNGLLDKPHLVFHNKSWGIK